MQVMHIGGLGARVVAMMPIRRQDHLSEIQIEDCL